MRFLNFQFLFAISNFYIGQNESLHILYSICVNQIGCPYLEIIFVCCSYKCCFIGKAFFVSSLDFRSTGQECHLRDCVVITDPWDWTIHREHNYSRCWVRMVLCEKRRQNSQKLSLFPQAYQVSSWESPIAGHRTLKLAPSSTFIVGITSSRVQSLQSLRTSHPPWLGKKAPKYAVRDTLKAKQTLLISSDPSARLFREQLC